MTTAGVHTDFSGQMSYGDYLQLDKLLTEIGRAHV